VFVSRDVLYTVGGGDKDGAYVKDVLVFDLHESKFLPNITPQGLWNAFHFVYSQRTDAFLIF
jgi:hypothetical protein